MRSGSNAGTRPGHAVVVLNWHGREDTIACVASLLDDDPTVDVLVVDNGSFDGALEAISARWPEVDVLQLASNAGFTGGMNAGIRHAMEELAATVVTVLNNDTIVLAGAMSRLRSQALTGAAVCPVIRYRDRPDSTWYGGGSLDARDGYPHHTPESALLRCVDGLRETEMLTGCCITATVDVWRRVGDFDDRFFLNFEDSEWSLRAKAHGVRLAVVCDAVILHAVSASFRGQAATLGSFYYLRNGLLFTNLAGAGVGARVRFVRRFGLGGLRRATWRARGRAVQLVAWAMWAYAFSRYGEAPSALVRRVGRWERRSAGSRRATQSAR